MVKDKKALTHRNVDDSFQLGAWKVIPSRLLLSRQGLTKHIEPRAMEVLLYLANSDNQVVSREALLQNIWGDVVVGDHALTRIISQLRKALKEPSNDYIETIPKRGYRLLVGCDTVQAKPGLGRVLIYGLVLTLILSITTYWVLIIKQSNQPDTSYNRLINIQEASKKVSWQTSAEIFPVVSNDGELIAFSSNNDNNSWDLYLHEQANDSARRITTSEDVDEYALAFSPDHSSIVFQRISEKRCQFIIKSLHSSEEVAFKDCTGHYLINVDWSPTSSLLAMPLSAFDTPSYSLSYYHVDDARTQNLNYEKSQDNDLSPRFSPSGSHLAFRRGPLPNSQLHVMTIDGMNQRVLVGLPSNIEAFDWLPDSEHLIWCEKDLTDQMYIINIHSGQAKRIYNDCLDAFVIAPESRQIIYEHRQQTSNILSIDLHTGELSPVIETSADDQFPASSPDGKGLVFVSNRSGQQQIWLARDGHYKKASQLTDFDESALSFPYWRPDGKAIIFLEKAWQGKTKLWELEFATGQLYERFATEKHLGPAIYSPFSEDIILSYSDAGTKNRLLFISATGEVDYTQIQGNHPQVLNKDSIAFVGNNKGDLMSLNHDRVINTLHTRQFSYHNYSSWVIANNLFYQVPARFPTSIRSSKIDGNQHVETQSIYQIPSGHTVRHFSFNQHRNILYFTEIDSNRTDIMSVDLDYFLSQGKLNNAD